MEWLKQHYERVILAVSILALLVCSGLVISASMDFPAQFADQNNPKPHDNTIKPLPIEALNSAERALQESRSWVPHEGSLLVSRPYVLKDGKLVDPLASDVNLHDPIKNSWLIKYELPYWEGNVAEQDPDGDRFSNLEEYLADTDPRDKQSVPPYYTKLRLQRFISKPFRLKFTGSPDDGHTFTVNFIDRRKATLFLELGQSIEGTPYKVLTYEKKSTSKNDMDVDTSTLTIQNTETGQKIVLVANQEANDPTFFAEFLYLYDGSKFTVKKDDDFTLAPEPDRKYKLIDISEGEAVIKDLQSGEQYKIPPVQ